jgi:dTDP-4-amino-4,6-dideoxygalactose transaminase
MYLPAWPSLSPGMLLQARCAEGLPFPLNAPRATYFFRARNAIYHLVRALHLRKDEIVLVPAYHHGNEVRAIRAAGASVRFYPISSRLEPDLEALEGLCREGARVLFVIHYLGWPQPLKALQALCQKWGVLLIEDCALALFSEVDGQPLGSFGDYAVYCLYKTLPVPHGGLLVQNTLLLEDLTRMTLKPCDFVSVAGRSTGLLLEWLRSRSNGLGETVGVLKQQATAALGALGVRQLPVGDTGFDLATVDVGMSAVSSWLLHRCDWKTIRQRRRRNFLFLQERVAEGATLLFENLPEGVCPLFFPLLVPDKRNAAEALWRRGIGAVEFWNEGDPEANREAFPDVQFLRDHVLELPIHQDLTPRQLGYMAEQVRSLKSHFEKDR